MLKLHNYFRSSTSTRLRAALKIKGLEYDYLSYALLKGENRAQGYLAKNPAGLVPSLELDDGTVLTQSLAIIEWLDEVHPDPALLPADPIGRARVRSLSYMIACEVHPVNNLRVLQHVEGLGGDKAEWFRHWVGVTFEALEAALAGHPDTGRFCHGDSPTMADLCLYAQVYNNKRFEVDMTPYPTVMRIFDACDALPAFAAAAPPNQPDAV